MKIVDLSYRLEPGMPVYPGDEMPVFRQIATVEKDGYNGGSVMLQYHAGTHVDAPHHMISGGVKIDAYPVSSFCGPATVADVRAFAGRNIGIEDLLPYEALFAEVEFLLLRTGWEAYWGKAAYMEGYPVLAKEAASWLTQFHLKGIGIEALSVDPVETETFENHHILLGGGLILIENLRNLKAVAAKIFDFTALPLAIWQGDGSPVRAVARF